MKKTMVLILALSVLAVALLAGCGETGTYRDDTTTTNPATTTDILPESMMPDVEDGVVSDNNTTNGTVNDTSNGMNGIGTTNGTTSNGTAGIGTNGTTANGATGTNGTGSTSNGGAGTASMTGTTANGTASIRR